METHTGLGRARRAAARRLKERVAALRDFLAGPAGRRLYAVAVALLALAWAAAARAQSVIPKIPGVGRAENPEDVVTSLEILFLLTVLTLAPALLVMVTAFTRIAIVLSFVRRALATQDIPPNQVVLGLSLILTFLVMQPTFVEIKDRALVPYMDGLITQKSAFREAVEPLRKFMFSQTRRKDLQLFVGIARLKLSSAPLRADIPTTVLVPAFVISELRRSFIMGFAIFLPFLVIDLVVSTTLISMGMLVLPPILVSLPFKILLFVLVDGWALVVGSVVKSFQVPGAT